MAKSRTKSPSKSKFPPRQKARARSSGPNGKEPSCQHDFAEQLFAGRIVAGESESALVLFRQYCEDLRLQGALELGIGAELVINRLLKSRLEKARALQFQTAQVQSAIDEVESRDGYCFQSPISGDETQTVPYEGPHATFRGLLLERLKEKVIEHGPEMEKDFSFLAVVFGDRRTTLRAAIVAQYYSMLDETLDKSTVKKGILAAIEGAIEGEKIRVDLERTKKILEYQQTLPPQSLFVYITKAMAATDREFRELLETLEAVRRLKRGPE
jgi:hypothetical protein